MAEPMDTKMMENAIHLQYKYQQSRDALAISLGEIEHLKTLVETMECRATKLKHTVNTLTSLGDISVDGAVLLLNEIDRMLNEKP